MTDSVLQEFLAELAGFVPVLHCVERQHGGQLLEGQRILFSNAAHRSDQHLCGVRNAESCRVRDDQRRSSDELGAHGSRSRPEQDLADLLSFLGAHEISALPPEFLDDLIFVAFLCDDRLLGRTDCAVVKALARDNVLHGLCDIRCSLDVRRGVSRADAESRFAGAVSSLDHSRTAGGDNHLDVRMMHQLVSCGHAGHRNASDGVCRRARRFCRLLH